MGLFDELTVEAELPDGFDPSGVVFQTRDTAEQFLGRYVMRADGELVNVESGEAEEHHGALEFYASNWAGSFGRLYATNDDQPPWRARYVALYDHGKRLRIDGGCGPVPDVEHVMRADFDRRCREQREGAFCGRGIAEGGTREPSAKPTLANAP